MKGRNWQELYVPPGCAISTSVLRNETYRLGRQGSRTTFGGFHRACWYVSHGIEEFGIVHRSRGKVSAEVHECSAGVQTFDNSTSIRRLRGSRSYGPNRYADAAFARNSLLPCFGACASAISLKSVFYSATLDLRSKWHSTCVHSMYMTGWKLRNRRAANGLGE